MSEQEAKPEAAEGRKVTCSNCLKNSEPQQKLNCTICPECRVVLEGL